MKIHEKFWLSVGLMLLVIFSVIVYGYNDSLIGLLYLSVFMVGMTLLKQFLIVFFNLFIFRKSFTQDYEIRIKIFEGNKFAENLFVRFNIFYWIIRVPTNCILKFNNFINSI